MTFGERLRNLRDERNIAPKTLSAVIGVSPRMVSFYESGAHFPRDEGILLRLAAYFQVSTDYLLGYSDVRQAGQLHKLNAAYEALPEAERKSLLEFLDFLSHNRSVRRYDRALRPPRQRVSWSAHVK